jgi:hypothetical protein
MASIDFDDFSGPPTDGLGLGLLGFHLLVGSYVMTGWILSSVAALAFYLLLLPTIAAQWHFNRGSCVINNLESRLRFGSWRHPDNRQEGAFLIMLCDWWFRSRPDPIRLDQLSYGTVAILWAVGAGHLLQIVVG